MLSASARQKFVLQMVPFADHQRKDIAAFVPKKKAEVKTKKGTTKYGLDNLKRFYRVRMGRREGG